MDTASLWQRYQDWLYYNEKLEFYLDISRMSFDEAFVEAMKPKFELTDKQFNTSYGPLCVVGQAIWERKALEPLREFKGLKMKKRDHSVGEKLQDTLLLILTGYPSLSLLTSKLKPDPMLAQTWHRWFSTRGEENNLLFTMDRKIIDCIVTIVI